MSFWNNIFFWQSKPQEKEEVIIPYKPGYEPSTQPTYDPIPDKPKNKWEELRPIDLSKIHTHPFAKDNYFQETYEKTQIVLHHTISGDGIEGDINTWEVDPSRVATCIIVDRAGIPWQLFSSKYWAYHLGANNAWLDRHSIGIEIDNWGWLIPGDGTTKTFGNNKKVKTVLGKFYAYYGNAVSVETQYYSPGFRGYNYYEKYTSAQIQTVGELILYWKRIYNIPVTYNTGMWNVSNDALGGKAGIWSHVSYRPAPQKYDCHPQPELISMLQSLEKIKI